MENAFPSDPLSQKCAFCSKHKDEAELIELGSNSIIIEGEIIEFEELFKNLFFAKLIDSGSTLICDDCKNLLVQFYIFKENVLSCQLIQPDVNLEKVQRYLDEYTDEEVHCSRYNKCLSLIPESKRAFMETFQLWQPHIILDKIAEISPVSHDTTSMRKFEATTSDCDPIQVELDEPPLKKAKIEDDVAEEIKLYEEDQYEITEDYWLQMEIDCSETVETENGEVTWLCKYCVTDPMHFDDFEEFKEHLSVHYQKTVEVTEFIEEEFVDDETQITSEEEPLKVKIEPKSKKDVAVSKTHQRNLQTPRFEKLLCVDCCYQFSTQAHYRAHLNGHQLYEVVAKHSDFPVCETCNVMFCDETYEVLHQEKHELGELTDEVIQADGEFLKHGTYRSDLESEISNDPCAIKCGHCTKKFMDKESCQLHQLIFHVTSLKCPIELREFKGNQAFSIHLRNNHPEMFGDEAKFLCSVCKMEFTTLYDKLNHMKNCDKKKFQCSHCEKKFSQKCYLMAHLRQVTGQASVVCEVCDKVCRDKGDYQIHFRSHSNIKPFKCSLCPKAYKTSSARAAHLETHNEVGYDCLFCKTNCRSRRTLQKHVKTKHPNKLVN